MARARRNVASPPPQQAQPNFQDFAAASGAAELLPPEAAVAAVPVAGALTTAAAAAAVAGVLGAFASFNVKRERALRTYLTDTLVRLYPDRTREEILRFVRDELARDRAFVRNQQERLQKDLIEAMKLDAEKRDARVQAVLDRERRYTQMHEQAAIERSAARTSFLNVKDASPDGALWMLGRATTHTPSCVGMAGKFWPWQVLDKLHPQLHAGCQCYLLGKDEAVERGFMHEDQARVDPKDALARAAEIAKLEDIVMEAATPEEIRAYLDAIQEAPYRLPHGVHGGGEFARRGQTGVPILARRSIEKLLRRLAPHPSTPAGRRRDGAGEWRRIGKREVFVPEHRAWERELDGKRFVSPPQSTAVYDREREPPVEVSPEKQEQLAQTGKDIKEQWRVHAFEKARGALAKQDRAVAPVEVGDRPQAAHKGLLDAGFYVSGQQFSERRNGPLTRTYEHPATQATVEMTAVKRKVTYVGWSPGRAPRRPTPLLDRPPATRDEFFDDVFSLAHALADEHGNEPHMTDVRIVDMPDMGGEHTWEGITHLGVDAHAALDALNRAKEEGRPLTFGESRLVYSLYRAASHEALHAAVPVRPRMYADMNDTTGRVLEEALTEELASVEAVNMLRRQGLTDVLRWVKANPTDFKVEGAYSRYRRVLSRVLDRAKVPPEERENVIRALKFGIDPEERADGLAALVAGSDLGRGMDHADTRHWMQSISNRSHALTAVQSEPIFAPNIRPDLSDIPDEEPVKVKGVPLFPGSRVSVRGRGSVGVVQQIYHRDDGPLLDVEYGPPGMRTGFDHGVHPDQIEGVGEPPEGISPRRGGVRIDGHVFQPGDTVSYLGDTGRTRATVERIIRAENPEIPAPRRGWQIEATTEAGVPVLLDHGRARGLRREERTMWHVSPSGNRASIEQEGLKLSDSPSKYVWLFQHPDDARASLDKPWGGDRNPDVYAVNVAGLDLKPDPHPGWPGVSSWISTEPIPAERVTRVASDVGYDPGVTGEVMTRSTPGGERSTPQAPAFQKYGPIPEKIKWKSASPGIYDSTDGRLTMYRVEGVRPPAWNVEWTIDYGNAVQDTGRVEGYSSPVYETIVDGAASMKDAKGFAEDEWPRLREVIAAWEAAQPEPQDKSFMPHRVEVAGWTADNDSVTWTGYGMTQDEAVEDAKRGGGIVEVGDVNVLPPLNPQTPGGERGIKWTRGTHPTGVPIYTSPDAPGLYIEAVQRLSHHVGMVFGNQTNEAGRVPRTEGWQVIEDERRVGPQHTTLAQAKAAAERRARAPQTPGGERDDYRGLHQAPAREEGMSLDDPTNAFGGDDIYGPMALRYYGPGGPAPHQDPETQAWARRSEKAGKESLAAIKAARGNPDHRLTVYRAVPKDGGVRIHPGDWVTPSKTYAELHGESNLSGYEEEPNLDWTLVSQEVRAGDLFTDGDLSEWGWQPEIEPYIPDAVSLANDLVSREWQIEHGYGKMVEQAGGTFFQEIPYRPSVARGREDKDALLMLYHYFTGSAEGWTGRKKQKDEVLAQAVERWKAANPRWAEQGWVKQ